MTGAVPPVAADESDYRTLRTSAGAVALGRDVLLVSGTDAVEYLQGQCSQDVAALGQGDCADALLLTPQGKLDALIRVTRTGADRFLIDVDSGFGDVVAVRLMRFRLRVKVEIEGLAWRCLGVRGPEVGSPATWSSRNGTEHVLPWSWGGAVGVDLLGPAPAVPDWVPTCSPGAWESVRVEAGVPVMGAELDERTIAAEADLLERAVSFTKGCYTGQELVARLDARGNRVARRLAGLVLTGPEGPVPAAGAAVTSVGPDGAGVGAVTSATWSYGLGTPVALAYLHRKVELPAALEIDAGAGVPTAAEGRDLPLVS